MLGQIEHQITPKTRKTQKRGILKVDVFFDFSDVWFNPR